MKAITIQAKGRYSTMRTVTTSILGAAAASAATFAVGEMARRRSNARGSSSSLLPRSIAGSGGWGRPINQRPVLFFDRGNVSRMLESATQLSVQSPAAAIAMLSFVAKHQCEFQHYARSLLTTQLQTSFPHPTAIWSSREALSESVQLDEGKLTSMLSSCELTFLRYVHSSRPIRASRLARLAEDLEEIAPEFGKRNDQRRQSSARIILADVYLEMGQFKEANEQMSRALVLIGTLYNDPELTKLSTEANGGPEIITRTYQDSTDPSVRKLEETARELAGNGTKYNG